MSSYGMKMASIRITFDVKVETVSEEKVVFETGSFGMMVPVELSALQVADALHKAINRITFDEPPPAENAEETS